MSATKGFSGGIGPLVYLADNWISRIGILLTTTGGVAWMFTLPMQFGGEANPYLALLSVFTLPAIFFLGLVLIPLGIRLKERRERKAGIYPTSFPAPSLANPEFRKLASFVLLATAANVVIGGHLTYSAVEYMDSTSFCGQACHIMDPEFTAWQFAPHSEVTCVECHIGEGAANLIEAKLNGTKQLIEVLTGTYPTPVPTPVHNLAQGDLTCGDCHSERDLGVKRKEWVRFAEDEQNTATRTEVLLAVGGGENPQGAHGAHMSGDAWVEYRSNEKRTEIPWMRYRSPAGEETVFASAGWNEARAEEFELRRMDCTDCHNRAAHSFEDASEAIDKAMAAGKIDPSLRFIKREGLAALKGGYESREQAREAIPQAIRSFYSAQGGASGGVEEAAAQLVAIYERNIFPQWGVDWQTHPNFNGHQTNPGCFRCHDDGHVTQDSDARAIGDDCTACHVILAEGQPVSAPDGGMTLTSTGGDGLPGAMSFDTPAGASSFNHAQHVNYENGECTACHNALFPMSRAPLGYGDNLHRTAEANKSSCAGCHVDGGEAFASANNCSRCHSGLSEPRTVRAAAAPVESALPGRMSYATDLGRVVFDHAEHVDLADGRCRECHNTLFDMSKSEELSYGGRDFHRAAEAAKTSCAGCHAPGEEAFAAADNCSRCHTGLGEPKPTPETGLSGIPSFPELSTRLGPARFDHEKHVDLAEGNCRSCHNQIFPLAKGLLGYKDNLHKTAESAKTSCGACHRPGGEAFASQDNCLKCHADASTQARGSELGLPELVNYANRLGPVAFNHDQHIVDAKGECKACHPDVFEMKPVGSLPRYSDNYHREAEANGTSCAKCHTPNGEAFGTLDNCTRCHEGLELNRQAALWGSPWMMLLLLAMPWNLAAQEKGGYVGSKRCAVCHEDQSHAFSGNPHALLATSQRWEAQEIACESCHGPGLAHVQALDPAPLAVWAEAQPDRVNQACLDCHRAGTEHSGRFFSDHLRNQVACTGCHQAHEAPARPLLISETDALCSSCHLEVSAAFRRPYTHNLHEGTISCVDCHPPHGQPQVSPATRVSVNETACLNCHGDKRGPFPFEHAPVKMESCSVCHEPHGSSNPRMMVRHNVAQLCLECHTTSLAALGGSPPAFHDLRSARFRSCTSCHSKIHGSFVSRDFLR